MRQQNNHKIPCKYGQTCKFLMMGNCHYYHPSKNQNHQYSRDNYNINSSPYSYNPERKPMSCHKKQNNYHQGNRGFENQSKFTMQRNPSFGGNIQFQNKVSYCRSYHLNNTCKFGEKCQKKHQFLYGNSQALRRLTHRRDIPQTKISQLCKIDGTDDEIFSIRLENEVFLLRFSVQENELNGQKIYQLPKISGKYQYYNQIDRYIYYSSENDTTKLADFGFHNILSKETVWIQNSHSAKITGILHYDEQTVYSSSMAGDIKVWTYSQNGYIYNKNTTEQITSMFNPQNKPMEILFLNLQTVNETKIMSAGTNDGRVLLWTPQQFMQVNVKDYIKIWKARTIVVQGIICSIVLAWDAMNNSAIWLFNLQTGQNMMIRQVQMNANNIQKALHLFQFIDDYLLISNLKGHVSIYKINEPTKKIGTILHQNILSSIICSNVRIKATGVSLKIIYILQQRKQETQGSFSIYLLQ